MSRSQWKEAVQPRAIPLTKAPTCPAEKWDLLVYRSNSRGSVRSSHQTVSDYTLRQWLPNTQNSYRENSINQSIKFIISVAHCRLDFTINSSNRSAMLNVNTTEITIVDETRECLSRQMMLIKLTELCFVLNNTGSWQPVGASEISFNFHFWHKSFIRDDVKLAELSSNSSDWKTVTF